MSLNSYPTVDIRKYSETGHYVDVKPIAGTNVFGGKNDVQIHKKTKAKPKHGILIAAGIIAGVIFLSYKLEERF